MLEFSAKKLRMVPVMRWGGTLSCRDTVLEPCLPGSVPIVYDPFLGGLAPAVKIPGACGAARKKGSSDAFCEGEGSKSYGSPPEIANLSN